MPTVHPLFHAGRTAPKAAIFLSGGGSNAEHLLERWDRDGRLDVNIAALVTDRPATSRATELGRRFGVPVVADDIRAFYAARGLTRVTLATPAGQEAREAWTDELRRALAPYRLDFGIFAGFVPLTNLVGDFPCLNVHPGDLTYEQNGTRHLVGLHTVPIERAILAGLDHLRSSVIVVEPYAGGGDNMDAGLLLGISPKVPIDLGGKTVAEWRALAASRPAARPPKGYGDALEALAARNQDRLKQGGDWVVFPRVVFAFATGRFGRDDANQLYYRQGKVWEPVTTVEFGPESTTLIH